MGVWCSGNMTLSKSDDEGSIPSTPATTKEDDLGDVKGIDMISRILEEMAENSYINISSPYMEEMRSIDGTTLKLVPAGLWTVSAEYSYIDEFGTKIESDLVASNRSLNAAVMEVYQSYKRLKEKSNGR